MAWSQDVTDLVMNQSSHVIERAYVLEIRNGFENLIDPDPEADNWTQIEIVKNSFGVQLEDGLPAVGNCRFKVGILTLQYLDEFDRSNPVQQFAEARIRLDITTSVGTESQYVFWGFIRASKINGFNYLIEAGDWLQKLDYASAVISLEALKDGPHEDVLLRHDTSGIWDTGAEEFTFEIDPTVVGQEWAEDILGGNRSWVQGAFTVQKLDGADWVDVAVSEYFIDTVLGLVRFYNDQAGESFRLSSVTVYIEGTLDVADAMEAAFTFGAPCPALGLGWGPEKLAENLTGTITFDVGDPYLVTGVGTAFLSELLPGDRILSHAELIPTKAIVAKIIDDSNLELVYPYDQIGGTPGTSGLYYKSTLRTSGIQVTNIRWAKCDGSVADLYRQLQQNYADSRGYRVWSDYEFQKIRGEQVAILTPPDSRIVDAAPVLPQGLAIDSTIEDFGTAVITKGQIGRGRNLMTDSGTTVTDVSNIGLPAQPEFGHSWELGPAVDSWPQTVNGVTYGASVDAVRDGTFELAYAIHHEVDNFTDEAALISQYNDFILIDLGAPFEVGQIHLYRIPSKAQGTAEQTMGVDILGSLTGTLTGTGRDFSPLTPETFHYEMANNEAKEFDCEGSASVRYLLIRGRPFQWPISGKERALGFREIIIFGSQTICQSACIQGEVAHGARQSGTGTITFEMDGTITGTGTSFGGVGEPGVGDYITSDGDEDHWIIIESVNAASGADCVTPRYPYGGNTPESGNLVWSDGSGTSIEGQGGHYVGTPGNPIEFIQDYYPDLVAKTSAYGNKDVFDDENIVVTEFQAVDRAYIILNEVIRIYRTITTEHPFDPRIKLYDTVHAIDDYRLSGNEDLYFLVLSITWDDNGVTLSGIEYGAGVLR